MKLLLYAPEYRPNLSSIIRSCEFFGLKEILIFDKNNLLQPPNNKTSRADMAHMARVWTAGAINHIEVTVVENVELLLKNHTGRSIATVLELDAQKSNEFQFQENDLIILGSEKEGLPKELYPLFTEKLYIPSLGETPCLNVAVTAGIILHKAILDMKA